MGFTIRRHDCRLASFRGEGQASLRNLCRLPRREEGNRALNSPRLDNKQDWYLIRQLKYFKYGARGTHPDDLYGQQMAAIMATVPNDQAIVDVVAYIMTMAKGPFN